MPVVSSGQISMSAINAEFGRGRTLGTYRGVQWFTPNALPTGNFSGGQIKMSDFYGKAGKDPATSGSLAWGPLGPTGAGSTSYNTFTMPLYRGSLQVRVWGGGGGGGSGFISGDGSPGNDSAVYLPGGITVLARGGGAGVRGGWIYRNYGAPGPGGIASGGNQLNNNGGNGSLYQGGNGGAGSTGGTHPFIPNSNGSDGGYPGAGGGGGQNDDYSGYWSIGGGGGGGAYTQSSYAPGAFTAGVIVQAHVGAGGAGGVSTAPAGGGNGGNGGAGRIEVQWN